MNTEKENTKEIAIFAGGCFWCTEAVFKMLRGVYSVTSGYIGGKTKNPTYEQVCNGNTGHAEAIQIEFNPKEISFANLLTVFFGSHDPTTLNRQGNDIGTQYRSAIFYTTEEQKEIAENFIREINASSSEGKKVVTEVVPATDFYKAEAYHADYYTRNSDAPYCEVIINPKLEKVQKQFASLLKNNLK